MAIELSGKLSQILPLQTGSSRNGEWKKLEFIIETDDQFPKKICMNLWGDKVEDMKNFAIGQAIKASVNIESREFNGRWYTDIRAWKIDSLSPSSQSANVQSNSSDPVDPEFFNSLVSENEGDDLPF